MVNISHNYFTKKLGDFIVFGLFCAKKYRLNFAKRDGEYDDLICGAIA